MTWNKSRTAKSYAPTILILLAVACIWTARLKSEAPAKLLLEVINRHHTMGRNISSVYLRVFSNGAVECHTQKYSGDEIDSVKRKSISTDELKKLKAVLENPELAKIGKKYGLMYMVVDSWMTWDISVYQGSNTQTFEVLNFAPGAAIEAGQPYPDSLIKLGCSIVRVRAEVFDGAQDQAGECETATRLR